MEGLGLAMVTVDIRAPTAWAPEYAVAPRCLAGAIGGATVPTAENVEAPAEALQQIRGEDEKAHCCDIATVECAVGRVEPLCEEQTSYTDWSYQKRQHPKKCSDTRIRRTIERRRNLQRKADVGENDRVARY